MEECGEHEDLAEWNRHHNHDRLTHVQDDAEDVVALLAMAVWHQPTRALLRVIAVCTGELDSQRNSVSVANQVTLAAELGSVSGNRSRLLPPKTARSELQSTIARDQSIFP